MAVYSKLKNVEEQAGIDQEYGDSESSHMLNTRARWNQKTRWGVLSVSFEGRWLLILAHLGLLAINIFILTFYASRGSFMWKCDTEPIKAGNPLKDRITYKEHRFETSMIYAADGTPNQKKPTSFLGPPRPELEAAWATLMNHSEVRVSREELGEFKNDDSLVQLSDGSGYYVTVSAFHGLHCVRRLHKFLWADHYYPSVSKSESFLLKGHAEHCLDWLQQYVQCHADPTLGPVHWNNVDNIPVAADSGNRMCVVWEPFEEWMAEHAFDPLEPGLLVHPLFGVPDTVKNAGKKVDVGIYNGTSVGLLHTDGH